MYSKVKLARRLLSITAHPTNNPGQATFSQVEIGYDMAIYRSVFELQAI
jgi:hypothetical protein